MLYYLVRPVARYVLSYYYRNIDITGLANIPPNSAVILAANHPTAFIEPCLMACFQSRTLHFLARGDLYKNPLATAVLRALNILPVYRMQDGGYSKLVRNYDTFDECYKALSRCKAIMILAEGRCIHEKRLRPLQKGTARIALGALDRDTTLGEVYIVPVGVNFTAAEKCRSTVMIRCGEPLRTSDFLAAYRGNEGEGIRQLTDSLRTALSEHVVQIPENEEDAASEMRLAIRRHDIELPLEGITHSGKQLDAELATARLNDPDEVRTLRYAARLKAFGIRDQDLTADRVQTFPIGCLPAIVLLAPFLPLWLLAEYIALRGPKTVEFYSPVRFAVLAVGTLLYLPVLFFIPWLWKVYLLISLFTVRWSIRKVEDLINWRHGRRVAKLSPSVRADLVNLRSTIL